MLTAIYKNKFEKDLKQLVKRGKNLDKLKKVMRTLISGKKLEKQYRDHPLKGEYSDCRECHLDIRRQLSLPVGDN